ncbi:hypothetical protein K449DRAFT_425639 [Hypoxylon sp. EC38]|nr:hypothetical protein K449DRAFT_425639 [Hypoxylon sp. EC38]
MALVEIFIPFLPINAKIIFLPLLLRYLLDKLNKELNNPAPELFKELFDKSSNKPFIALGNKVVLPGRLQMTGKRKIGVSVIFSFGILIIACAAGKVYANQTLPYINEGDNTNYGLNLIYLWELAEVTCVLLMFSMSNRRVARTLNLNYYSTNG